MGNGEITISFKLHYNEINTYTWLSMIITVECLSNVNFGQITRQIYVISNILE